MAAAISSYTLQMNEMKKKKKEEKVRSDTLVKLAQKVGIRDEENMPNVRLVCQ